MPTQAELDYSYATSGMSAINSIMSSMATTQAFKDIETAKTDRIVANIGNTMDAYEYNAYQTKEDMKILDDAYADKVSARTLKGMQDMGRLKALQAESGGSAKEVSLQAKVDTMFDVAVINTNRRNSKLGIAKRSNEAKMNAMNTVASLSSESVSVNGSALISGLAGATNAFGNILISMPDSVKADMFKVETSSGINGSQVASSIPYTWEDEDKSY